MARHINNEKHAIVEELFDRLHIEFGNQAPAIIKTIVSVVERSRVTFPDLQYLYRQERNRRIQVEFNGMNYEELAIKYKLKIRQVRRVLARG